ncbi:MAG: hypothetical protein WCH31_04945 [Actinomycetes bacterium]
MSRSVEGLLVVNALFGVTGFAVLWAVRGFRTWVEVVEFAGLAVMTGIACVCLGANALLPLGFGLSLPVVLGMAAAVLATAVTVGVRQRRRLPTRLGIVWRRPSPGEAAVAGFIGVVVAFLLLDLRLARVLPLGSYDGWWFWIPKAKGIYYYGGLDEQLLRSLPEQAAPLFIPSLQAIDFRFMGSTQAVPLALQYWALFAAFVFAAAAILRRFVPAWLVWPFLALVAFTPEIDYRVTMAQADWPLDMYFVLAAVCLAGWLVRRDRILLLGFGFMIAATIALKREGTLLAICLVAAALLAHPRAVRAVWVPVCGVAALAYAPTVPWVIWWTTRRFTSDAASGVSPSVLRSHTHRVGPAFHLVIRLMFDYAHWFVTLPIALIAALAVLGSRDRARAVAILLLGTTVFATLGFTWILWQYTGVPLDTKQSSTPIPRAVGAIVLLGAVLAPLLIDALLRPGRWRAAPPAETTTSPHEIPAVR